MSDPRSPGSPGPPSSGGPWLIPHDSWFHSENDPSMLSIKHYRCIIFSSSIFQKQKRQILWLAVVGVQTLIVRCCIDDTWPYNVIVDSCNTQCLGLSDKHAKEHIIIHLILGSFGLLLVRQKKTRGWHLHIYPHRSLLQFLSHLFTCLQSKNWHVSPEIRPHIKDILKYFNSSTTYKYRVRSGCH